MSQTTEAIARFSGIVAQSQNIVFFGGAGVSTESGIPDFRSPDGLYYQKYDDPPEQILSHTFFLQKPDTFFRFYRDKIIAYDAQPNAAHLALAALERAGRLKAVLTQNIDGLHQAAGSKEVLELHGSIHRNHCTRCGKAYTLNEVRAMPLVPRCACGGVIKPDVVLYEEPLNETTLARSVDAVRAAQTLIVAGTSLSVYPAAGLCRYFCGEHLILINLSETPLDDRADLVIHEKVGKVFATLNE